MADTTFRNILPPLKAIDLGDGTYAVAVIPLVESETAQNITFTNILPPLKAVDLGDDTYAVAVYVV